MGRESFKPLGEIPRPHQQELTLQFDGSVILLNNQEVNTALILGYRKSHSKKIPFPLISVTRERTLAIRPTDDPTEILKPRPEEIPGTFGTIYIGFRTDNRFNNFYVGEENHFFIKHRDRSAVTLDHNASLPFRALVFNRGFDEILYLSELQKMQAKKGTQ